jgi:hypothetical protein
MGRRCLAAVVFTGVLALAGCKQGEGERCEVDNDCSGGLSCDNPKLTGGLCTSRPGTAPPVDAALDVARPPADTGTPDRPVDAAIPPTPDAAVDHPEDRTPDAAPRDGADGGDVGS